MNRKWISIDERLPKHGMECLVMAYHMVYPDQGSTMCFGTYFDGHGWSVDWEVSSEWTQVTHWMPKPKHPKGKIDE